MATRVVAVVNFHHQADGGSEEAHDERPKDDLPAEGSTEPPPAQGQPEELLRFPTWRAASCRPCPHATPLQPRFGHLSRPSKPADSLRRGPWYGHERPSRVILNGMFAAKAHVEQGRLKLDEPTSLPEGEIVELVPLADLLTRGGDDLDDEERRELHAALDEAEADIAAGRVVSEEEMWATLRAINK